MKKIVLPVLLAALALSFCVVARAAQGTYGMPKSGKTAQPSEVEDVSGKVDSVMAADPATGMKAMVTVVDSKGEKTVFEVTPTTTLYGADMKPITLDAIKKDALVKVKGTSIKEGTGVATSIRLEK